MLGPNAGLIFTGLCLTEPDLREGISKASNKPYCIRTQKALAGTQTYKIVAFGQVQSDLPDPIEVGIAFRMAVTDANKEARSSDIELRGEILVD